MGRRPWTLRLTVEECLCLNVTELRVAGTFDATPGTKGSISWESGLEGIRFGPLRFEAWKDWAGSVAIRVPAQRLNLAGMSMRSPGQTVRLAVTRPHFGGERCWFLCECGKRVGRLYLPPEQSIFRCRHCHDLTYRSAQEHNTRAEKDREWVEYLQELLGEQFRVRSPAGLE